MSYSQYNNANEQFIRENSIMRGQIDMLRSAITQIAKSAGIVNSNVDLLTGPECLLATIDIQNAFTSNDKLIDHLVHAAKQNDVTICQDEDDNWWVINHREEVSTVNGDWLDALIDNPPEPSDELRKAIERYHNMRKYAVPTEYAPHILTYDFICKD